eukprot:Skav229991  [mRNA]  locus=scaffold4047:43740:45374:+ [translate_table: standard]
MLVVYHVSGAIATNIVRGKYDMQHEDQKCTFCDMRDTLEHRLFECPITDEARGKTAQWQDFRQLSRAALHCPLVPHHEEEAFHRACCYLREVDIQPVNDDKFCLFYTDGSMDSPADGVTCAAFSIVCLENPTVDNIQQWIGLFRQEGTMPPFTVASSGKVPGSQTINRAEFLAIIKAISLSLRVDIVTDSAYARELALRVIAFPVATAFVKHLNFDLILQLIHVLTQGPPRHISIRKIQSHQELDPSLDDSELLDRLGNAFADTVANLQRTQDALGFIDMHARLRASFVHWRERLLGFFQFIILTAIAFQQAWKEVRTPGSSDTFDERIEQLCTKVHGPYKDFSAVVLTDDMLRQAFYTIQYTQALLWWAKQLQWSATEAEDGVGVTYTELILSFSRATGLGVPVNLSADKTPHYVMRDHSVAAAAVPRSRHQDVRVFSYSLSYLVQLTGADQFPLQAKAMVSSLTFTGIPKARSGFRLRCKFPFEREVLDHISKSVSVGQGHWSLDHISNCPGGPSDPVVGVLSDDLAVSTRLRYSRFKQARR